MNFFSKEELKGVGIILAIMIALAVYNFNLAFRRARDAQRKTNLGSISNALHDFQRDFGFFPPAKEKKILACKGDKFNEYLAEVKSEEELNLERYFNALIPCQWGEDALGDIADESYPPYLKVIFSDPKQEEGISYSYFSNTKRFQIYAYLEGEKSEDGYNEGITARKLLCGTKICSFGKSFGATPLEKSIEEYENELLEEKAKTQGLNFK